MNTSQVKGLAVLLSLTTAALLVIQPAASADNSSYRERLKEARKELREAREDLRDIRRDYRNDYRYPRYQRPFIYWRYNYYPRYNYRYNRYPYNWNYPYNYQYQYQYPSIYW